MILMYSSSSVLIQYDTKHDNILVQQREVLTFINDTNKNIGYPYLVLRSMVGRGLSTDGRGLITGGQGGRYTASSIRMRFISLTSPHAGR